MSLNYRCRFQPCLMDENHVLLATRQKSRKCSEDAGGGAPRGEAFMIISTSESCILNVIWEVWPSNLFQRERARKHCDSEHFSSLGRRICNKTPCRQVFCKVLEARAETQPLQNSPPQRPRGRRIWHAALDDPNLKIIKNKKTVILKHFWGQGLQIETENRPQEVFLCVSSAEAGNTTCTELAPLAFWACLVIQARRSMT